MQKMASGGILYFFKMIINFLSFENMGPTLANFQYRCTPGVNIKSVNISYVFSMPFPYSGGCPRTSSMLFSNLGFKLPTPPPSSITFCPQFVQLNFAHLFFLSTPGEHLYQKSTHTFPSINLFWKNNRLLSILFTRLSKLSSFSLLLN